MNALALRCLPLALILAACGPPTVHVDEPLSAVNWSPHDGASGIELAWEPSVCLSLPVESGSLGFASLREGSAEPGEVPETRVDADVALSSSDARCIVFHEPDLAPDRTYHMVLAPGLETTDGTVLDYRLSSQFRTAAE